KAPYGSALAPGSVLQAASVVGWQSKHKIGLAHLLARGTNGVGRGKTPGKVHVTAAAIVTGVENVHILAQNVATHFHHVAAANHGEIVRVVVRGGGEQLLGADIGVTQAGGVGEAVDGKQPGAGILHAQFAGNISRPLIGASVVQHEIIHADARLIHQSRTDGPRPVDDAVLEGSDIEAVIEEGSRVNARLILASVGIPRAQIVLFGGLIVQLEVALIALDVAGRGVEVI